MKRISIFMVMFLFTGMLFAQESSQGKAPLSKGEREMNFGLGFGSGLPAYWGMEWAVHNDVTVGGNVALNLAGFDYMILLARADYHWNRLIGIPPEWDFYAGVSLGGDIGFSDYDSGLHFDAHVGGRWFWSDKWGLNLEVGGGTGFGASLGVTMKF